MLKKLSAHVREYRGAAILAPVFVILESILEILIPTVMALLIDRGIQPGDTSALVRYGIVLLILAAFSLTFGILAGRYAAVASAGFAKNLRHDLFHKVQGFSFSNIDDFSTGSIITRLTTDVTNMQNAFQMIVRLGFRAPAMFIFALIFAFRIDAGLSLIFVSAIPLLLAGTLFIIYKVHPVFRKAFRAYDRLNNIVQENLHGIRVVKTFTRESYETKKFTTVSADIYRYFVGAGKFTAFNIPLVQFCLYLCILLLGWFGAKDIIASGNDGAIGLTTGDLTALITYAMQILISLMMVCMIFIMLIISRTSAERVMEILDTESDLTSPVDGLIEVPDGSIEFCDVRFAYSADAERPVLDGIDLSISSGETIGIIGGTGSSKSSLVQLIPRLYDVTGGELRVGGHDVRDYHLHALRDGVAMVLQKNTLFSGTVKENLRWGKADATEEEMAEVCRLAQADDFIRALPEGYDAPVEQGGSNFSGGQRQRLCIARALLKRPRILILDDSTSAVDTKTDGLIRAALRDLLPQTTKLIIAQRVASVQEADRILVLDDGRVMAFAPHDELVQSCDIYRELYESQTKGGVLSE